MSLQLPKPPGSAARQCHRSGQTLGKGLAWTVSIGAAEPAGRHSDRDRPSLPRQIMEHAPIDAVDAPGCHAASRTFGGARAGRCLDGDMIRGRQHTGHLERPRDERQQGRGHGIGTMDVSPGLSPIQPSSTSPTSTQCAEEPEIRRLRHRDRLALCRQSLNLAKLRDDLLRLVPPPCHRSILQKGSSDPHYGRTTSWGTGQRPRFARPAKSSGPAICDWSAGAVPQSIVSLQ